MIVFVFILILMVIYINRIWIGVHRILLRCGFFTAIRERHYVYRLAMEGVDVSGSDFMRYPRFHTFWDAYYTHY